MLRALTIGVCVLGAAACAAPVVTIYSGGFGLVHETRSVLLAQEGDLLLENLSRTVLLDSVLLGGIAWTRLDPIVPPSPQLADLVGKAVVVYGGGERFQGVLLAVRGGLVLSTEDGIVFLSSYDRVVAPSSFFSGGGDSLTLKVRYRGAVPGSTEIGLTYLVQGLSWTVSYAATLRGEVLGLQGGVALDNQTGVEYSGAQVSLVAGDVYRPKAREPEGLGVRLLAAAPEFDRAPAFEYHRYTLLGPVDLGPGTVLVPFLYGDLPFARAYRFSGGEVEVRVRFTNGLAPLPAGEVRVYDEGLFVGAAAIGHTPLGAAVDLAIGAAFDLRGERIQELRQRLTDALYRDTYRITLRSSKDTPVEVEVVESLPGTWTITHTSSPYERIDAQRILYRVTVPAGGEAEVRYTVEWRY